MTLKEQYEKETGKKGYNNLFDDFVKYPSREYAFWLKQKAEEGQSAIEAIWNIIGDIDGDKVGRIEYLLLCLPDYQAKEVKK